MAQLPILVTPRLKLVPFGKEHLTDHYVAWLNDPEVVRYSEQRHRRHTLESCASYWSAFGNSPHYFCAIMRKGEIDEHIGNVTIVMDLPNRVADLAIVIGDKTCWGHGYGSEAWVMLMRELAKNHAIRKITAGTMAVNTGMLTVMQRAGMLEEGRRKRHFIWEGQEVDMVMFAIFSDAC